MAEPKLTEYRRKRDGAGRRSRSPMARRRPTGALRFVVQRHSARALHYDFRLERDGVLASWAVPKGLPTTRGARRLAVHVEDHPLEYGGFEGEIPQGEYGGGVVDIYDTGTYEVESEQDDGRLTFDLHGARLQGRWSLVPAHMGGEERNWLLICRDGPEAADPAGAVRPDAGAARRAAAGRRRLAARGEAGRVPRRRTARRRRRDAVVAQRP